MPMEVLQSLTAGVSEVLVYVAIGLVTLTGLCKCIYPVFRNGTLLNRAVIKLEKATAQGKPPLWRDARFLGRALRGDWQRFLLNAGQLDLRGMPCDIDEYINEDTVIYKPGHAQLAELIPSLLTSLGILGTFMGMMEGLSGLDFSNAEGTIGSIPHLLEGMRFAFATSVAGILCSLAFNMTNRIVVGRAFKALDTFEEAFYDLAMARPLDPEVQMICQRQDDEARLQEAADRFGGQVAGALELAVGRAMHPLTLSMDHFIKGATQEQVDGVKKIVDQFVQQLNASLDGQMTALADTMRRVNQGQAQTQQNLQRSLQTAEMLAMDAKRIQEASREIAERMRALSADMQREETQRKHGAGSVATGDLQASLGQKLETLNLSLTRMAAAVDEVTGRMDRQAFLLQSRMPAAEPMGSPGLWEEDPVALWDEASMTANARSRGNRKARGKNRPTGLEA